MKLHQMFGYAALGVAPLLAGCGERKTPSHPPNKSSSVSFPGYLVSHLEKKYPGISSYDSNQDGRINREEARNYAIKKTIEGLEKPDPRLERWLQETSGLAAYTPELRDLMDRYGEE